MEVPCRREEFRYGTKLAVCVDLLEIGLRETVRILAVLALRSRNELLTVAFDGFLVHDWSPMPALLGRELEAIGPQPWILIVAERRRNENAAVVKVACG